MGYYQTAAEVAERIRSRPAYQGYKRALARTAKAHDCLHLAFGVSGCTTWAALCNIEDKSVEQGKGVIYGQGRPEMEWSKPWLSVYYFPFEDRQHPNRGTERQAIGDRFVQELAVEGIWYTWNGSAENSITVLL
jgi:hypothetical protein